MSALDRALGLVTMAERVTSHPLTQRALKWLMSPKRKAIREARRAKRRDRRARRRERRD